MRRGRRPVAAVHQRSEQPDARLPGVEPEREGPKDASEWLPPNSRCWFVKTVIFVNFGPRPQHRSGGAGRVGQSVDVLHARRGRRRRGRRAPTTLRSRRFLWSSPTPAPTVAQRHIHRVRQGTVDPGFPSVPCPVRQPSAAGPGSLAERDGVQTDIVGGMGSGNSAFSRKLFILCWLCRQRSVRYEVHGTIRAVLRTVPHRACLTAAAVPHQQLAQDIRQ